MKMTDYAILCEQLKSLIEGVPFQTANLANASALLWQELPDLNWVGFYLRLGQELVLGPFEGKPACIRIPCDCASNSEIVVPIFHCGEVAAVLDLDSPLFSRFTPADQQGLEAFVRILKAEWGNMT